MERGKVQRCSRGEKMFHRTCKALARSSRGGMSKDVRAVRRDCTTQEPTRALRITRLLLENLLLGFRRTQREQKSTKNRSKIDEHPPQIDPKSMENRSWTVLGAHNRFGDSSGCARDGWCTPRCRPKADLGAPRARQERPGIVQKCPWAAPATLQEPPRGSSERLWCAKCRRARLRIDFSSFLRRRADAPMCVSHQF